MSKISYIFVLFCFSFVLKSISGFYEQDSIHAVDLINQQITEGLYAATAERSSNFARSFGAKIHTTSNNNAKNKLRPKPKQRLNLNQFVSNDIPFVPSRQIPLLPSLKQRSGAAIKYAQAEKLVAADNLIPIINKPNFKPSPQTTFQPITTTRSM